MGLLDSVVGNVLGQVTGGNSGVMQAIGGLLNSSEGGLQGLVQTFEGQGLGNLIQSWIGTGANLPINAEQLQSVLGGERVQSLVQSMGGSQTGALSELAQALPQLVDKLTPDGAIPSSESLQGMLGSLGGLLGKS